MLVQQMAREEVVVATFHLGTLYFIQLYFADSLPIPLEGVIPRRTRGLVNRQSDSFRVVGFLA